LYSLQKYRAQINIKKNSCSIENLSITMNKTLRIKNNVNYSELSVLKTKSLRVIKDRNSSAKRTQPPAQVFVDKEKKAKSQKEVLSLKPINNADGQNVSSESSDRTSPDNKRKLDEISRPKAQNHQMVVGLKDSFLSLVCTPVVPEKNKKRAHFGSVPKPQTSEIEDVQTSEMCLANCLEIKDKSRAQPALVPVPITRSNDSPPNNSLSISWRRYTEEINDLHMRAHADAPARPEFKNPSLCPIEEDLSCNMRPKSRDPVSSTTRVILEQLQQTTAKVDQLVASFAAEKECLSQTSAIADTKLSCQPIERVTEAEFWKRRYEELAELRETEAEKAYNDLLGQMAEREKALEEIANFYQSQFQCANLINAMKTPAKITSSHLLESNKKYDGIAPQTFGNHKLLDNKESHPVSDGGSLAELQAKCEKQRRQILLYQALTSLCITFSQEDKENCDGAYDFGTATCTAINHLQERVVQFKLSLSETEDEEVLYTPVANLHFLPAFLKDQFKFCAKDMPLFYIRLAQSVYSKTALSSNDC